MRDARRLFAKRRRPKLMTWLSVSRGAVLREVRKLLSTLIDAAIYTMSASSERLWCDE
ncbi:hypothetical protein PLANPX_3922 [Lacipirellula parvula]|uniref:Uncharacterized protein n=1 Tax=Lacipirellula parvula TaxID=2650471 RepID=A0A5K7XBX1_9BACT|nr:hypothetical protein PLANPX_3922 [Lacipirellula parvula]